MKENIKNTIILFAIMIVSIIYFEVLFKIRVLAFAFDGNLLRIVLFSFAYAFLFMFFFKFFKERTVKILFYITNIIIMFLYFNQEIYSSFVEGFYSLSVAGDFTLGLSFFWDYVRALRFWHLLYLLPLITTIILSRKQLINFKIEYDGLKQPLVFLFSFTVLFFSSLQTIDETVEGSDDDNGYSDMDLYTYMYNSQDALKKFGLLTYTQRDFFSLFRTDPLTEDEYVVLLDDYFKNQEYHSANSYTNLFRNKNLILITAESLDTFAIHEDLTPTLYNLKNNYAYFNNYYSPLYYRSTADTEFQVQTSSYPDKNVTLSMEHYMDNEFPYTLPKLFGQLDYDTYSFHNYTDYFYPRTEFHEKTLGYDVYYGSERLGMLDNPEEGEIINSHVWQSDLEMMEKAVPLFIQSDSFFVNMLTVSGHFAYGTTHEIAMKHIDEVQQYEADNGLDYPDKIEYYLAANMELDLAIEYLIEQLEFYNKMDDTVIIIFGDHYAYGIEEETIWEYDDIKEDENEMDLHNVPMMIISQSYLLDEPMDNYMSSIDFIPTISNLFGLPLDYKAVFGTDALGTPDHIIRFADLSFVSKNFSYDSLTEEYTITDGADYDTSDLLAIRNSFINDYQYNVLMLQYNYWKQDDEE